LPGARFNIAASCFLAPADGIAVVSGGEEGGLSSLTYAELEALSARVADGLTRAGLKPGDAAAIALPLSARAVAIYLGLVLAGCVVVSIADSLAADEIAVRLRIAEAKAVFTQDVIRRAGKELPLYERVVAAGALRAIVLPAGASPAVSLRAGDVAWDDFLGSRERFEPVLRDPHDVTNVLFSSGTTGEPKAIGWDHTSPIKPAVDARWHQDVQPHDRLVWPTNLGWVMGPWLIYSSLLNRAAMAIFEGAPTGRPFGEFLAAARATIVGVIPSLVKTWRSTACMEGLDWSAIRHFSSTGECSNPDDMLYLMALAGYKPVIEYCGGTELAGGYIGATLLQPNVPSTFTTPSPGVDFVILNESGRPAETGEVFLVPPSIGMTTRLLNRDHDAVYFADAPLDETGQPLRRHGDCLERLPAGYFRAHGRVDDTMNLGGIKVSSAEIERVLNAVPGVVETAAIAVPPPGGGPSLLWVFAVPAPPPEAAHESAANDPRDALLSAMRSRLREHLNPLFKIERLELVAAMPRTPTNKIMRRRLRDEALAAQRKAEHPASTTERPASTTERPASAG
jgi:acetyl-CoA synthetase